MCAGCFLKIKILDAQECFNCGRWSETGETCRACKAEVQLDGLIVAADYRGKIISQLVKLLKYNFIEDIAPILAKIILKQLSLSAEFETRNNLIIMPVPLHPKRERWRGFNQAELIARAVAAGLDKTVDAKSLARIRNIKPQTRFNQEERRENVRDCFSFTGDKQNIKGKIVLLIDDVVTTGATISECAKALKAAGAKTVWAVAVARG